MGGGWCEAVGRGEAEVRWCVVNSVDLTWPNHDELRIFAGAGKYSHSVDVKRSCSGEEFMLGKVCSCW